MTRVFAPAPALEDWNDDVGGCRDDWYFVAYATYSPFFGVSRESDCSWAVARACVLLKFLNFTVANTEGHDPLGIEHPTCSLNSTAGPTDDEHAVSLRHEFSWFEGFDLHVSTKLLKEVGHTARAFVSAGVVRHRAWQMPDHVFG